MRFCHPIVYQRASYQQQDLSLRLSFRFISISRLLYACDRLNWLFDIKKQTLISECTPLFSSAINTVKCGCCCVKLKFSFVLQWVESSRAFRIFHVHYAPSSGSTANYWRVVWHCERRDFGDKTGSVLLCILIVTSRANSINDTCYNVVLIWATVLL